MTSTSSVRTYGGWRERRGFGVAGMDGRGTAIAIGAGVLALAVGMFTTTGLLLVTDDGQWSHRITSPRHECAKTYRAWLADPVEPAVVEQFAAGVQLRGERQLTRPAELQLVTPTEALLTIHEGKYHQVKRMFAAVGNKVIRLHREKVGVLSLGSELAPGEYRPLTADEIAAF